MAVLISDIKARQVIDSRANPTIETEVELNNGIRAIYAVPSGASKGQREALELRDNDNDYLFSKSVLKAVSNVNNVIKKELILKSPFEQFEIDNLLFEIDGTDNFSNIGANAALSVSMAVMEAASKSLGVELFNYIGGMYSFLMPTPLINIINGGAHSNNNLDLQEFIIVPCGAESFSQAIRMSLEVFHKLKEILDSKNYKTSLGDEGGYSPELNNTKEALEIILDAIFESGYTTDEIKLAVDVASSEFYKDGYYHLKGENKILSSDEMIKYLVDLCQNYPIISVEDGLSQSDIEGWKKLTNEFKDKKILLVGDDLFVTNSEILKQGIKDGIANSVLIKPNQIGTITKTFECVSLAKIKGYKTIISHRSGETENTAIADISVGLNAGFIKTGSVARGERTAKYNRLLRIEECLGQKAKYLGYELIK